MLLYSVDKDGKKKMKKLKKTNSMKTAALIAAMTIAPMVSIVPVHAEGTTTTTPTTTTTTTTTFDKYVLMKKNANVPNATFSYTIAPLSDKEMSAVVDTNNTNLTIRKGVGQPTVSTTAFTADQITYTKNATSTTNQGSQTYTSTKEDNVDGLDNDHKYAKTQATVDFTGITFGQPGVYRYKVTENATSEKGITIDSSSRYLDVYVENVNGANQITGYVFHTTNAAQKKDGTKPEGKKKGFTNTYTTYNLNITNKVTGNQGYTDETFHYNVVITNLDGGEKIDVTDKDGNTIRTYTAGDNGTVSIDTNVKTGDKITINGLSNDAHYTITQTSNDYTTTATKDGSNIGLSHDGTSHTYTTPNEELTNDDTVEFTNNRNGVLPTGIYHNNRAAFAIAGIAAMGGCLAIAVKKHRKHQEDAMND